VSNKNSVELIGWYGGDKAIARAAWTSTSIDVEAKSPEQIQKLLVHTLWNNESDKPHKSPFERGIVEFNITVEQASHIHALKHRMANINGESARYKELKEDRYYIPEDFYQVRNSMEIFDMNPYYPIGVGEMNWAEILDEYTVAGNALYHKCLADLAPVLGRKRAKESARFFKTMNSQLTLSVMMNMSCFANFYSLRADEAAQVEIREIAELMIQAIENIEGNPFKYTLEAFAYSKPKVGEDWLTEVLEEPVVEVKENPIWRVICKKGFVYNGVRTASIRTHEYNKAVQEGFTIELLCEEYDTITTLTPEQVATKWLVTSKFFKSVNPSNPDYQLFNYCVD